MSGLRLILIAVFIWIVWVFVKNAYRKQLVKKQQAAENEKTESSSSKIVKCAVCGVHVPQSEALVAGGKFFCSEAHRRENI